METSTTSRRDEILADPGFGKHLTDHMVTARFAISSEGVGTWSPSTLEPLADLALSPAAMVLHYGQAIFEGLKAYRQPDGSVSLFRVADNAARFNRSAARMAISTSTCTPRAASTISASPSAPAPSRKSARFLTKCGKTSGGRWNRENCNCRSTRFIRSPRSGGRSSTWKPTNTSARSW